jgi:histidinol dehydrogenase
LRKFTAEFDKADVKNLEVSEQEKYFALNQVDTNIFDAIKVAAENITAFHKKQLQLTEKIETMPGIICWRKSVAIEKVGLYIPGGTAPLFSTVLMLTIPAVLAGCKEIIILHSRHPPKEKYILQYWLRRATLESTKFIRLAVLRPLLP